MSKKQNEKISQLHRLQGQLRAIEVMINKGEKTPKIVQQIEAVCGSLKSLEKKLLSDNLKSIKDSDLRKSIEFALKK